MRNMWLVARVYAPEEGGVQTYAQAVARAYAALGWRVTIFAKSSLGPRRECEDGVELIDVGPAGMMAVYCRLFRAMLAAWWQGDRPEMIHACTWRAALPALLFPRPLAITVHGREVGRPRRVAFLLMRLALWRARLVVAVSDTTRDLLLARLPQLGHRCVKAWNGVTPPARRVATAFQTGMDGPHILSVCRLVPRKNIPAALVATMDLMKRRPRLHYSIVGRGIESLRLRHIAQESGMSEQVTLAGYVSAEALDTYYRTADIFLHPQIALEDGDEIEGFGLSIADAMAHGLVCIVGRDGGPSELIRNGITGFVVDGRSPEAIREIVEMVSADRELCRRIGHQARLWALGSLSWDQHCRICVTHMMDRPTGHPIAEARHGG